MALAMALALAQRAYPLVSAPAQDTEHVNRHAPNVHAECQQRPSTAVLFQFLFRACNGACAHSTLPKPFLNARKSRRIQAGTTRPTVGVSKRRNRSAPRAGKSLIKGRDLLTPTRTTSPGPSRAARAGGSPPAVRRFDSPRVRPFRLARDNADVGKKTQRRRIPRG